MHTRLATALVLGAALTWSSAASGAPKRVALVDAAEDDAMAIRMRSELAAAGFSVVEVDAWPADAEPSTVTALLAPSTVVAAVRVYDDRTEVWLLDARTHAAFLREVVQAEASDTQENVTVAVRAVEVVRAELTATRRRPKRKRAVIDDVIDADSAPASPPRRPFALDLGAGFSASPGGVPVAPTFTFGATWMPSDHVGVAVLALASPFSSGVDDVEGRADVWTGLAGAGLAIEPTGQQAKWGVRLEAGLAAAWLHMIGNAEPPYESGSASIVAAAPYVRPSLRWRLTPGFAVHLSAITAMAFPRPVISFAGREAATWGRPVVAGSLGVELSP